MSSMQELAGCYRSVVRHAKGLKLRSSRERLGSYILRQSYLAGNVPSFVLPVEKRLLASYLGMTPENLSRALRSLEDSGVKVDGQRIIITDRAALTALARPDPLIDGPDPEGINAGATLPGVSRTG
jgi:CRP/FNR family transcriptional regulator, transcriptional activator FtrB